MRAAFALALILVALGCGSGANTQALPIGSRCSSNGDCGTNPFGCATQGYPGGYCQKGCMTDPDCPSDSTCVNLQCRRKCHTVADCRASEGYACRPTSTSSVCDVPGGAVVVDMASPTD